MLSSFSYFYTSNQLFKRRCLLDGRLRSGWILSQIAPVCNLICKRGEPVAAAARRKIQHIVDGREQVDAALVYVVGHMRVARVEMPHRPLGIARKYR